MLNVALPEVKRFYRAAAAHLDAARALLDRCPEKGLSTRGHEVVYLSGYVVECSLKALLLTQYPRKKHPELVEWFKTEVKHNLERLRAELIDKGVNFPKGQTADLKLVHSRWYSEMRYDVRGWRSRRSRAGVPGRRTSVRLGERRMTVPQARKKSQAEKVQDQTTAQIFAALKKEFPDLPDDPSQVVYRYNPVSVRVRVISSRFVGKTSAERGAMVAAAYEPLPPDATDDITMELTLTPREAKQSYQRLSQEFDDPTGEYL